jgi:hypothetical protein
MRILPLICVLLVAASTKIVAQVNLYDSASAMHGMQWVMGLNSIRVDFRTGALPTVDTLRYGPPTPGCVIVFGGSNICDKYGNIALVCNGYWIYDKWGYSLTGMEPINCKLGTKFFKKYDAPNQMSICLPKSEWDYYVITAGMSDKAYQHAEDSFFLFKESALDVVSYCVVHVDSASGQASMLVQDSIVLQDKWFANERMTAVRHGNGRDWWLVKPHHTKQQFYTFLVTSQGISVHDSIDYGGDLVNYIGVRGECQFSPDGEHFAMAKDYIDSTNPVYLYDFDRCNGVFSNYRKLSVPLNDTFDSADFVAFSPDSKMLYVSSYEQIFQIPVSATSVDSFYKVAGYDTIDYYVWYNYLATAPNGKLYIGNFNVVRKEMSYIDKPNERGAACAFTPLGFRQNITNLAIPPNMPNYALGRKLRSPCDTVYTKLPPLPPAPVPNTWALYPNPTSGSINIAVPDSAATSITLVVHNALGQKIASQAIPVNAQHIAEYNLQYAAKGIYFLQVRSGQQRFTGKVVKE